MCECLCGDISGDHVYQTYRNGLTHVVIIDEYPGCDGCGNGPGVNLHILPRDEAAEFLPHLTAEQMDSLPELPTGEWFTLFEPQDLVEAARQLQDDEDVSLDDYDLEGVMSDYGHRLIALACRIKWKRVRAATKGRE